LYLAVLSLYEFVKLHWFEDAGGEHLKELDKMKVFGELYFRGIISQYNDTSPTDSTVNVFLGITKAQTWESSSVSE
jgi:NADPH-dependent curcumin reductase CurA